MATGQSTIQVGDGFLFDVAKRLQPRRIRFALFSIIAVITAASLGGLSLRFLFDNAQIDRWSYVFDVDRERNVPSIYSGLALLAASALLLCTGLIHRRRSQKSIGWFGLTAIFAFMAYDELFQVHEPFGRAIREALDTDGFLYFAWYLVYAPLALVIALMYRRFLLDLPTLTRNRFIIAGLLFALGAIGFEILGSAVFAGGEGFRTPDVNWAAFTFLYSVEELLEMVGIALFVYAIADYITTHLVGPKTNAAD